MGKALPLNEMSALEFGKFSENVKVVRAEVRGISHPLFIDDFVTVGLFLQMPDKDYDIPGKFLDAIIHTADYGGLVSLLARLNAGHSKQFRTYGTIIVGGDYTQNGLDISSIKIEKEGGHNPSSRDYNFR